jgi:HEAT repeat protein
MKLRIFIILLCMCLLGSHADAAEKPAGEKGADRLIALLADENFKVREEAALNLWKLGAEALPALKSAANDADPEKSTAYRTRHHARDRTRRDRAHRSICDGDA